MLKDERTKIFIGEGAKFAQLRPNKLLLSGGFTGNQFNLKLAEFGLTDYLLSEGEMNIRYNRYIDVGLHPQLARMGHLAFWDDEEKKMMLFGGQKAGRKMASQSQRTMMNDIIVYDPEQNDIVEHLQFTE